MGVFFLRTDTENIKAAEHLAPSPELDRLSLPGFVGIMAVDDERRLPVGLCICQMVGIDRLDIVWLFVHEDFRNRGIGEQLIMAACDVAAERGYEDIGFRLEDRDLTDEDIRDLNGFLVSCGFGLGFEIEGSLMADVTGSDLYMDNIEGYGDVVSVYETDLEEMEEFVKDLSPIFDYDNFSENSYAPELSFSYKKEGELEGMLLGRAMGEVIYIIFLEPSNNEDVAGLLLKALIKKAKGLGIKTISAVRTESNKEVLDKLFGTTAFLPAYLWLARSDMYNEAEAEGEDEDPIYVSAPEEVRWLQTENYGDVL